jgi:hypothetical protein
VGLHSLGTQLLTKQGVKCWVVGKYRDIRGIAFVARTDMSYVLE